MHFSIIIPAHNEERNILYCLYSLEQQTHQDWSIVIVNDGSTDGTQEKVNNFIVESSKKEQIKLLNLKTSEHQPGAKVVHTFNKGLQEIDYEKTDIICKFDADIIFPNDYLAKINAVYEKNPKVGMASGIVKIKKQVLDYQQAYDFKNYNQHWQFEDISSKNHVRGPIKSYRKACFEDMKGLRPVLGWDNIDVLLAQMHHWEIVTLKDVWVKHLRPTAYQYKKQKAQKLGEYFYNIGLNFPLTLISAAKASWKSKSIGEFFTIMNSFSKQNHDLVLTQDEIQFIRSTRTKGFLQKLGLK